MTALEFFKLDNPDFDHTHQLNIFYRDTLVDFAQRYHDHEHETKQEQSEKDILFKILFELRNDVNELKNKS